MLGRTRTLDSHASRLRRKLNLQALLLTDVVLPGQSGVRLARALAELRPTLPIVLMSGYGGAEDRLGVATSGLPLVRKPFTGAGLREAIASAWASRSAD